MKSSGFLATVAEFGDYSRQCGQAIKKYEYWRPTSECDRRPTNDRPKGQFTHFGKISNGHNSATRQPIPFMFGSRVGFSRTADRTAPFPVRSDSKWRPAAILENFKRPYLSDASSDRLRVSFSGGVFGDGRSNGTISGWIKSKMAAEGDLGKLQMAISQQRIIRFTVCMYADHILPSVSNL